MRAIESLDLDLKYAVRTLRRSPGFAGLAILTLAVGIGTSVTMFGVLDGVLVRELPVRDEDELVMLWTDAPAGVWDHLPIFQGELTAFRERTRTFEAIGASRFRAPPSKCSAILAAAAAVGLLLLIACVNVANLLLIRGSARIHEIAIRGAQSSKNPGVGLY